MAFEVLEPEEQSPGFEVLEPENPVPDLGRSADAFNQQWAGSLPTKPINQLNAGEILGLPPAIRGGVMEMEGEAPRQAGVIAKVAPFLSREDDLSKQRIGNILQTQLPPPLPVSSVAEDVLKSTTTGAFDDAVAKLGVSKQTLTDAFDAISAAAASSGAAESGVADPQKIYETMINQPRRNPSKAEEVIAGGHQAVMESLNFFTSPLGVATLGVGTLPKAAQQAIATAFVVDMSSKVPGQVEALIEAMKSGDFEAASKAAVGLGLSGAFITQGAKGIAKASQPKTERPSDAITQPKTEAQAPVLKEEAPAKIADPIETMPLSDQGKLGHGPGIEYGTKLSEADVPHLESKYKEATEEMKNSFRSGKSPEEQLAAFGRMNFYGGALMGATRGAHPISGINYQGYLKQKEAVAAKAAPAKQSSAPKPSELPKNAPKEPVQPEAGKPVTLTGEQKPAPALEAQPEMVGMGAAVPGEIAPPVQFKTSNKNATVDSERKARGLPPMMETERRSNQSAWDEAMRRVDESPQLQDELINELTVHPRALEPVENAMLMHRRIDLRNEYEKALHRWRQAFESDDMVRAAEESQRVKDWSSKLSDLENITKQTGAESGRSLQARKMMANEDYTLATMELQAMEAKGRTLTPDEHIQLIKAHEKIAALEARLRELEDGREAKEVDSETATTMKGVAAEAPKEAKSKDFDIDREENLVGAIKAKIDKGQLNEITPLIQQLARVLWRRGIRTREPMIDGLHEILKTISPELTREDTQRAFSGYGNFKPLSKQEIDVGLRDLRGQTQQVLKLEALEARKPLEKTGVERRIPTDEERRLIKQVNELKRKYGVAVTDPATQLKSALAARKTYYEHRIADLKHEIETRQRIVKTKSASPRDVELDAMIAEHERLKAEHEQIFGEREITDEQRLKMALAAAERNQAHWETRLENAKKGNFEGRKPGKKVTSAELEAIKARTEEIKEHVQELKDLANPKKTKEEIALQSLKTRMKTRMADLQERMAKGDFAKRERKPVQLDAEGNKIKAELDTVKEEFNRRLEQDRWAKMSVFQKTRRKIADVYDAARALMTTGEFSFILRQGKLAALSHPLQTAKALPDMFKALLASEQKAHEIDLAVHNHPDAAAARAAKLHLVEEGTSLHKQEEILMGRWVGKIPVVKNFNRSAQVFLNRIRFDMWKAMRKSLSKSGTPTLAEDRQIAMFVNEATGRGGLGKAEAAAVPLARVFFSPRYAMSRWQLASGHSLWGGTMRTRRIIATEYARSLVGLGLYYAALSMMFSGDKDYEEIETDPRSTDFGKIKIGDTRLDPLAGLSQAIVLAARTGTGEKKTLTGKVQPIRGEGVKFGGDKWSDIAKRYLQGKLHPIPSSVANLFDGTDLGGDEATVLNQAGNMVAPITYADIYVALREQDLDDGAALALLALLGEGLQTYKAKEENKK